MTAITRMIFHKILKNFSLFQLEVSGHGSSVRMHSTGSTSTSSLPPNVRRIGVGGSSSGQPTITLQSPAGNQAAQQNQQNLQLQLPGPQQQQFNPSNMQVGEICANLLLLFLLYSSSLLGRSGPQPAGLRARRRQRGGPRPPRQGRAHHQRLAGHHAVASGSAVRSRGHVRAVVAEWAHEVLDFFIPFPFLPMTPGESYRKEKMRKRRRTSHFFFYGVFTFHFHFPNSNSGRKK